MKTFFQVILIGIIALSATACLNEDITGALKAETTAGDFNSLLSTGILQKLNDVQTKSLTLTGTNGLRVVTLTISEVGADTTTNCLTVGTYGLSNITNNAQLVYATGTTTYTDVIEATIEITNCDEDESAISGTFSGKVASATGDTITFSNGTFEDIVFQ